MKKKNYKRYIRKRIKKELQILKKELEQEIPQKMGTSLLKTLERIN